MYCMDWLTQVIRVALKKRVCFRRRYVSLISLDFTNSDPFPLKLAVPPNRNGLLLELCSTFTARLAIVPSFTGFEGGDDGVPMKKKGKNPERKKMLPIDTMRFDICDWRLAPHRKHFHLLPSDCQKQEEKSTFVPDSLPRHSNPYC